MAKAKSTLSIPGPQTIQSARLDNGVQVLVYQNRTTETVYMVGILGGGGDQDPPKKTGLAHFTANLLSRGAKSLPFQAFHSLLESAGASLSFSCSGRHTWFNGKALAEDTELLFRLAADGLRNPAFPEEYVERLRRQLITGLALRDQDTSEVASLMFDSYLFPNHPYGLPVDGFPHTVKPISRDDIVEFHQAQFAPQDLTIVVSGGIEPEHVHKLAEKYFADWDAESQPARITHPVPQAPEKTIRKHHYLSGKSQVDLIAGGFGPARVSSDYLPAVVGNNILGQFGLMGRIGKAVRTDAGLAYFASSSITAWSDAGTWDVSAGANPENTEKVIKLIRKEIKRFTDEPVTNEELDNTKSHLVGRMPMALETNAGIANAILTMHRFDLGYDYYQKYSDLVMAISPEDIQTTVQKYLHADRLVTVSAGPGKEID